MSMRLFIFNFNVNVMHFDGWKTFCSYVRGIQSTFAEGHPEFKGGGKPLWGSALDEKILKTAGIPVNLLLRIVKKNGKKVKNK